MRASSFLHSFTSITSFLSAVRAFSVTVGTPTQCDGLTVSWTGGQAPFEILLTPVFKVPQTISVPASAFSNGKGSYSIPQLPFMSGTQFLLTMSDATSFGSGGTTTTLTVGNPVAKNNCNTTGPSVDFTFDLPSALQQCSAYTFDQYDGAIQPITIMALIPGGESLVLHPSTGSSFNWVVDVSSGTNLVFVMTDSKGRQGGSSDLLTVSHSNDASCLNTNSPSSTASIHSSTISGVTPTSSGASPTSSQSTSSGSNVATIAGTVIGCLVALAALVTLGMFLLRKRRASHSQYVMSSSKRHSRRFPSVDLDHEANRNSDIPRIYPFPYQTDSVRHLTPIQPGTQSQQTNTTTGNYALSDPPRSFSHSRQGSNNDSFVGYGGAGVSSSAGSRKAAMAGQSAYKNATRLIVHTDADDILPDDNGVVELPPQYSERRQPQPVQRPMSSYSEYSGPTELAYAGTVPVLSPRQSQSDPFHDP